MTPPDPSETSWIKLALSGGVPRRSFYVAVVVGTVLNLINQGDAIAIGGEINYAKLALTYMVPYMVATYGAVTAKRAIARIAAHGKG